MSAANALISGVITKANPVKKNILFIIDAAIILIILGLLACLTIEDYPKELYKGTIATLIGFAVAFGLGSYLISNVHLVK